MTDKSDPPIGTQRLTHAVIETIRSFVDRTGLLLGLSAAFLIGYLELGDWMLRNGLISSADHDAGVLVALAGGVPLFVATVTIFILRLREIRSGLSEDS